MRKKQQIIWIVNLSVWQNSSFLLNFSILHFFFHLLFFIAVHFSWWENHNTINLSIDIHCFGFLLGSRATVMEKKQGKRRSFAIFEFISSSTRSFWFDLEEKEEERRGILKWRNWLKKIRTVVYCCSLLLLLFFVWIIKLSSKTQLINDDDDDDGAKADAWWWRWWWFLMMMLVMVMKMMITHAVIFVVWWSNRRKKKNTHLKTAEKRKWAFLAISA